MAKNKYWKLDIISIRQRKVKITLYKKALSDFLASSSSLKKANTEKPA